MRRHGNVPRGGTQRPAAARSTRQCGSARQPERLHPAPTDRAAGVDENHAQHHRRRHRGTRHTRHRNRDLLPRTPRSGTGRACRCLPTPRGADNLDGHRPRKPPSPHLRATAHAPGRRHGRRSARPAGPRRRPGDAAGLRSRISIRNAIHHRTNEVCRDGAIARDGHTPICQAPNDVVPRHGAPRLHPPSHTMGHPR